MIIGQSLGYSIPGVQGVTEGLYACQRIQDTIESIDENESSDGNMKPEIRGNIKFQYVTFSYPTLPYHTVLNNVSFEIQAGQRIAFVGETGCGKSTIINLLERMYDNYQGEIQIDGVEIKQIDRNWIRSNIGLVNQDPILFNCSIFENISHGKLGATESEVYAAAVSANIHHFITTLPKGYNTI